MLAAHARGNHAPGWRPGCLAPRPCKSGPFRRGGVKGEAMRAGMEAAATDPSSGGANGGAEGGCGKAESGLGDGIASDPSGAVASGAEGGAGVSGTQASPQAAQRSGLPRASSASGMR